MSIVSSDVVFKALVAAGIVAEGDRVSRVVIDLQVGNAPVLHIRRFGDSRLLEVVETLAGVEVRDGSGDEESGLKAASEHWGIPVERLRIMPKHERDCALVTTHHLTCTCGVLAKATSGDVVARCEGELGGHEWSDPRSGRLQCVRCTARPVTAGSQVSWSTPPAKAAADA